MKIFLLIIGGLIISAVGALVLMKNITKMVEKPNPSAAPQSQIITITTPSPTPKNYRELNYEDIVYSVYYSQLNGQKLEIIPNFTKKSTSTEIVKGASCKAAINGGFYTKEGEPLGLFIANGRTYQENITGDKTLLTGYFSFMNDKPLISADKPENSTNIIQTGPLILNGNPFQTTQDEPKRRSVIIQSESGDYFALSILEKEDQFSGPTLASLPPILFAIETPFKIIKALNLDGGSASIFYSEEGVKITELTPVGSIICIR